jgi:pimeloyl-ACP methyl ester carboxylesterase
MPEEKKGVVGRLAGFARRNRLVSAVILIIILIVLITLGMQLALYINFITGNDIVISLAANRTGFSLSHGEKERAGFEIIGTANPFCRIECESSFFYISGNKTIETEAFYLRAQIARKKEYEITASNGTGQDLYRFSVSCRNVKSFLCHTSEKRTARSVLITVEYGLNEGEKMLKEMLKQEVEAYSEIFGNLNASIAYLNSRVEAVNDTLAITESAKFGDAERQSEMTAEYFRKSGKLWEEQDYAEMKNNLALLESSLFNFQEIHDDLNGIIRSNISFYNSIVENLTAINQSLASLAELELNQTYLLEAENMIDAFNTNISLFASSRTIMEKAAIAAGMHHDISKFYSASYGNETRFRTNRTVEFGIGKINLEEPPAGTFALHLEEQQPECCVFGRCMECCAACEKYPIIFLHGHDFNKDISAYYSLNAFAELQKALEKEGYLDAGEISLLTARRGSPGILGMSMPITVRASYYFDIFFSRMGRYIPVQTKSENIDTYAIRLKELVDNMKYETNQSRAIIIAHSMGGLVARRYIQIFGAGSIEKLILVNVPNHGITGKVREYCSFLGASLECRDMDADSLFINKLNQHNLTEMVRTYNILGTGCQMDEGLGDGIVLEQNAILDSAENYIIEGQCSGINLLHGELLDISKYPEFYDLIREILKE